MLDRETATKWVSAMKSGKYQWGAHFYRKLNRDEEPCYCAIGVLAAELGVAGIEAARMVQTDNLFDPITRANDESDSIRGYGPVIALIETQFGLNPAIA